MGFQLVMGVPPVMDGLGKIPSRENLGIFRGIPPYFRKPPIFRLSKSFHEFVAASDMISVPTRRGFLVVHLVGFAMPVCRIAEQEKYWSVPLRGFRLGRNSTEDLLHLLLPFERHPED